MTATVTAIDDIARSSASPIIPANDPNHDSHGMEYFLKDKSIGPLTGLSMRFAELHLNKEPYKLPEYLRKKIFYGMAACYMLRGESHMIEELEQDDRTPLDPTTIVDLTMLVCDPGPSDQNRFVLLLSDHDQLKREYLDVERDLNMQQMQQRQIAANKQLRRRAPEKQDELYGTLERGIYHTLRRGLGVSLAGGDMKKVKEYAGQLRDFPNREQYEHFGHTRAVIDYLDNGGAKALRKAAAFRLGTNPQFWHIQWGTNEVPGPMQKYWREVKLDAKVNWASNLIYSAAGGAVTAGLLWLLNHSSAAQQAAKHLSVYGR